MMERIDIALKILDPRLGSEFPLPSYATRGSAGVDIRAMFEHETVIKPGETVLTPAGFSVYIKDPAVAGFVYPRSGLGYKHGIVLANLTGVIDSDYQGPIMVPLWNRSDKSFTVTPGDRIAQLVFQHVLLADFKICDDFGATSSRGQQGFGSTGIH